MLTQERLFEIFDYSDGKLIWKIDKSKNVKAGSVAGHTAKDGYVRVSVDKKDYLIHRLVFLWHKGYLPACIDHIDRNPSNNQIENLREATVTQNNGNSKLNKKNSSGLKGVCWHKKLCKWVARITIKNKSKYLGVFETKEDAYSAYCKEAKQYFGEFANV